MALGYEAIVRMQLQVSPLPDETIVLCTGTGIPRNRNRIVSSSGYGGIIGDAGGGDYSDMGMNSPFNYDWEVYDGSINFDLHRTLWEDQLEPWIFNRQNRCVIELNQRFGDRQQFQYCFWNSISLTAAEDALINGSVGFVAIDRENSLYAQENYEDNVRGYVDGGSGLGMFNDLPETLNRDKFNVPVPSWVTRLFIDDNSAFADFSNWTLNFSQDVVKFFTCEHNANPQEPSFIAVGPMSAELNCEYVFVSGTPQFTAPDEIDELDIHLFGDGPSIKLKRLELDTVSDDVPGQDAPVPLAASYLIYELDRAS